MSMAAYVWFKPCCKLTLVEILVALVETREQILETHMSNVTEKVQPSLQSALLTSIK